MIWGLLTFYAASPQSESNEYIMRDISCSTNDQDQGGMQYCKECIGKTCTYLPTIILQLWNDDQFESKLNFTDMCNIFTCIQADNDQLKKGKKLKVWNRNAFLINSEENLKNNWLQGSLGQCPWCQKFQLQRK
jgi:hypothetical protein